MPRLTLPDLLYSTTFTLLLLLLFGLVLFPAGDVLYQTLTRTSQPNNAISVAAAYFCTLALSLTLYITRIVKIRRRITSLPSCTAAPKLPFVDAALDRSARVLKTARPKERVFIPWRRVVRELPGVLGREGLGLREWLLEEGVEEGLVERFVEMYELERWGRRVLLQQDLEGVKELMQVFGEVLRRVQEDGEDDEVEEGVRLRVTQASPVGPRRRHASVDAEVEEWGGVRLRVHASA